MQLGSLYSLILAFSLLVSPAAANGGLFNWADCISSWKTSNKVTTTTTDGKFTTATLTGSCATPSIVIADSKKREERDDIPLRFSERSSGELYPKAALGITLVTPQADDLYEVVCNFKAANSDFLSSTVSTSQVKKLGFSGTGCGQDFDLIKDSTCNVDNWCEWSTSIVIKPEKVDGKCCLPSDLSLDIEFNVDSSVVMSAWESIFKTSFSWTCGSSSGSYSTISDWSSFFDSSLSKRDDSYFDSTNSAGIRQQKRFADFSSLCSSFADYASSSHSFDKFCWNCDCTQATSSTVSSTKTSSSNQVTSTTSSSSTTPGKPSTSSCTTNSWTKPGKPSTSSCSSSTPVVPSTESSSTPVVPSTESSSTPVVPSTESSSTPVVPSTEISSTPVVPSTESSSTPVVPSTEISSTPVVPSTENTSSTSCTTSEGSSTPVVPSTENTSSMNSPTSGTKQGKPTTDQYTTTTSWNTAEDSSTTSYTTSSTENISSDHGKNVTSATAESDTSTAVAESTVTTSTAADFVSASSASATTYEGSGSKVAGNWTNFVLFVITLMIV